MCDKTRVQVLGGAQVGKKCDAPKHDLALAHSPMVPQRPPSTLVRDLGAAVKAHL